MDDAQNDARRPVIAGVDGSDHSLTAAELAAREADRRELPLEIVHAFLLPALARPMSVPPDLPPVPATGDLDDAAIRKHAEELLSLVASQLRASHPDLPMISRLRDGHPGEVLIQASRQASLVVVGHRGAGGFTELLTGSVGLQLANHSAAPVIIARGRIDQTGPVVVGIDGSEGSRRAAEFAAETADRYGADLVASYVWPVDNVWPPALAQAGHPPPTVPAEVDEILAGLAEAYPQVTVHPVVRQGVIPAHAELIAASRNARLVVVGSRGRGGFRGLLLGSVSQALIHHAGCPVAVVGPAAT